MAADRIQYLRCFFTFSALLLFEVCLHDVQADVLSCQHVLHKKVGDTVELSSCLPAEGVTAAKWKYGGSTITNKDKTGDGKQFKGRLELNPTNFSLTVRELTLQDSGEFSFMSEVRTQRDTVSVTLKVHDSITKQPNLTGNSTWQAFTNSCMVLLQCSVNSDIDVSYNWTVGKEIRNGPRLQYNLETQDGDTEFTCTIYNPVSEMSASTTVKCTINPQEINSGRLNVGIVIGVASAILLVIGIVGLAVFFHCRQSPEDGESNDQTLYADINEVALEAGDLSTMMPCSVYETIENSADPVAPAPQTVYDKIQFNRTKKESVSAYQDIS
ncbi:SLAM family member 5-like isoform X1 [Labrus mixtus]|uniref:SLAM family member 5-like isoform X1 n=1 Tax=Labrus mixtus TaxID=508554 RepID=UPI0029C08AC9|nr:SLAM family member 5-like isoform X1 [Labrus mixtus]